MAEEEEEEEGGGGGAGLEGAAALRGAFCAGGAVLFTACSSTGVHVIGCVSVLGSSARDRECDYWSVAHVIGCVCQYWAREHVMWLSSV
eukprot:986629-Rhodomonas_salina.1